MNPRNNNGDQPSNSAGTGTIYVIVPIPSTTSATVIPSTTVVPIMLPEGTVLSLIPQSHLVTPRPVMALDYRPFPTNFTMPIPEREQPFGMPIMVMASL